jgi:hypothetical protein
MGERLKKEDAVCWGRRVWPLVLVALTLFSVVNAWAEESTIPSQESSGDAPEISAILPAWGPSGWVFSLTVQGHNLTGASEVRFYPPTGIVVEDEPVVSGDGTVATVKVTILVHAPLGPRLVVVKTPAGQSSLKPTEANTFKVSFAHLH